MLFLVPLTLPFSLAVSTTAAVAVCSSGVCLGDRFSLYNQSKRESSFLFSTFSYPQCEQKLAYVRKNNDLMNCQGIYKKISDLSSIYSISLCAAVGGSTACRTSERANEVYGPLSTCYRWAMDVDRRRRVNCDIICSKKCRISLVKRNDGLTYGVFL